MGRGELDFGGDFYSKHLFWGICQKVWGTSPLPALRARAGNFFASTQPTQLGGEGGRKHWNEAKQIRDFPISILFLTVFDFPNGVSHNHVYVSYALGERQHRLIQNKHSYLPSESVARTIDEIHESFIVDFEEIARGVPAVTLQRVQPDE